MDEYLIAYMVCRDGQRWSVTVGGKTLNLHLICFDSDSDSDFVYEICSDYDPDSIYEIHLVDI